MIEDQEDLAELYKESLKQAGYKVRNAYTGEEGIAEFRANGADLIVLDITLPEMNGAQALRQIRDVSPATPVIIITGETHEALRQQCERLGVYAYLSKPVNYDAMLAAIQSAFEEAPEEAEVVTLRLPASVLEQLAKIDDNLGRAITRLLDERREKAMTAEG
ncbi:MAG TPA: response regulator [Pyrinomonadaceae bacterium]